MKTEGAIEHRILRKDGSVRWVSNTPVLHHDPGGRLISYDGVIRDITERKQAEEELQKLASLVRYSSELVNLATLDGRMIFLNETGCRMLGICPDDVERVSISQVIPDHLHEKLQGELLPALMSGGTWEGDLQYRNLETGRLTDVHAITFTITDQGTGAPLFLANVSQDITERKRAEEEKRRLETQLIQAHKMEALGTLAGGIAHDFNNILSAIIAYAQRGMQHAPDTDKVRKSLDEILKVSGRARDLVKQILAFSRRTTHEYAQVKLDATIKESLKMLRAILPKTIEIRQSLPTNGWVMARRNPDAPGGDEPLCQCSPGHGRMGRGSGGGPEQGPGPVKVSRRSIWDCPRSLCEAHHKRLGARHAPGGSGADLRSLLHHQGEGPRHGTGIVGRARHREEPQGSDHLQERTGRRNHLRNLPAGGRIQEGGGCAAGRRHPPETEWNGEDPLH
ncbi:MAG: PAS domain S-box protein [Desulfobacterales bacterium]|nr:PAS domain S-box protein [Desulfobacterales bacterium]